MDLKWILVGLGAVLLIVGAGVGVCGLLKGGDGRRTGTP